MKSLPASVLLVAAAIMQAMGMYQYTADSITVSGQVFFPILFALMAVYLSWRNKESRRFAIAHVVLIVLGLAALVLTVIGNVALVFSLYPSPIIYYAAFALLVVELFLRVFAMPKKSRDRKDQPDLKPRRRQRVAGRGPTNLVARSKGSEPSTAARPDEADAGDPADADGAGDSEYADDSAARDASSATDTSRAAGAFRASGTAGASGATDAVEPRR